MGNLKPLPPIARLLERFYYDFERDCLCYHGQEYLPPDYADKPLVGQLKKDGYRYARLLKRSTPVHRIVWAVVHKEDPYPFEIDHKNEDKADNRIGNLRLATLSQNRHNISAGQGKQGMPRGVIPYGRRKFAACFAIDGTRTVIPGFATVEEAHNAYKTLKNLCAAEFSPWHCGTE